MQVTGLQHEAHPSSASAVIQAAYQSIEDIYLYSEEDIDAINLETLSIDFSHPQKGGTEVGNVSSRDIVLNVDSSNVRLIDLEDEIMKIIKISQRSINCSYRSLSL